MMMVVVVDAASQFSYLVKHGLRSEEEIQVARDA